MTLELLVTQSVPTTRKVREQYAPAIGRLVTPRHYPSIAETVAEGITLAADNDGFGGVDFDAFVKMLDALEPFAASVRFVTVPDRVCDAAGTFELWREWAPIVRGRGLTPALVLQNGMIPAPAGVRFGHDVIAWDEIGAVFVGGDDAYKLGADVALIVFEAKRRGLWVHVGRVNTVRRLRHAEALHADSVDGSGWARFRDAMLPRYTRWIDAGRPADLRDLTVELPAEEGEELMTETPATKRCPRCGETKDRATGFTHRSDGSIFSWCRDCNRDYRRERAAAKREGKSS